MEVFCLPLASTGVSGGEGRHTCNGADMCGGL